MPTNPSRATVAIDDAMLGVIDAEDALRAAAHHHREAGVYLARAFRAATTSTRPNLVLLRGLAEEVTRSKRRHERAPLLPEAA